MVIREDSPKADLYDATIPLTAVANLVVVGRLFARQASAASLWWDDYMIVYDNQNYSYSRSQIGRLAYAIRFRISTDLTAILLLPIEL